MGTLHDPVANSTVEFIALVTREIPIWKDVAQTANIKLE